MRRGFAALVLSALFFGAACGSTTSPDVDRTAAISALAAPSTLSTTPPSISAPNSTAPNSASTSTGTVDEGVASEIPTAEDPLRVLLIGDSVTYEMAPPLFAALESTGAVDATEVTQWGFALSSDRRIRWRETWPGLLRNAEPDLVIIQTGTWDIDVNILAAEREPNPEDPGWEQFFAQTLDEAAFRLTFGGAEVLWLSMLPGPDPSTSERLNEATLALADRNSSVDWLDAAEPVRAADGSFVEVDLSGRFLRKPDGVHLCVDGAQVVTEEIVDYLTERYDLTFGDWADGDWRDSGRFRLDPCLDVAAGNLVVAGSEEDQPG